MLNDALLAESGGSLLHHRVKIDAKPTFAGDAPALPVLPRKQTDALAFKPHPQSPRALSKGVIAALKNIAN